MPHFIALVKFPKPDSALHQPLHVHPFVLAFSPAAAVHFPGAHSFPHSLTGGMPRSPATAPGPLDRALTLQNKWVLKTSPSGLQFASQGWGTAEKQTALFAKGILKQLPFTSAVQECWARQNNEPSVHSSLLPLSLSSGLKSELPKNGWVPLHLRPPCLHPAKVFWPFFFVLFLRALAKSSFKPQPFVRWYPIYPALSSDQKMPPARRSIPCYHPWRQSGTQEP